MRAIRWSLSLGAGGVFMLLGSNAWATTCPPNFFLDVNHICVPIQPFSGPGVPINPNPGQPLPQEQLKQFAPVILNIPEAKRNTKQVTNNISNRVGVMIRPPVASMVKPVPISMPPQPGIAPTIRAPTPVPGAPMPGAPTPVPGAPGAPGSPGAPAPKQQPGSAPGPGPGPGQAPDDQRSGLGLPDQRADLNGDNGFGLAVMQRGVSAGDATTKYGAWGNVQHTRSLDQDTPTLETRTSMNTQTLGFDMRVTPRLLAGLALVREDSKAIIAEVDRVETEAYSTVPYMAYQYNDTVVADGLLGWTNTDDEQNVTDSRRWMAAAGVRGYYVLTGWLFSSRLGYIVSDTELKSTSVKTRYDQATLSVDASRGYETAWIPVVEPYAGLSLEQDMRHEGTKADYDESGVLVNFGARFQFKPTLTGELKFESNEARRNLAERSFTANLRYEF